jgi:uncharacterized Rmd1/YagE family protein
MLNEEPRSTTHFFNAVTFSRGLSPQELSTFVPKLETRTRTRELRIPLVVEGEIRGSYRQPQPNLEQMHIRLASVQEVILYPFGVVVFRNVAPRVQNAWIDRLTAFPGMQQAPGGENFQILEEDGATAQVSPGTLILDSLSPKWVDIVAQTLAQSAAMENYEGIVDDLYARTRDIVRSLHRTGKMSMQVRPFQRFLGEAMGVRNHVLSNLHLLDKPVSVSAASMGLVYADLRSEFDLGDRYRLLEAKLRGIREALELVLGVARKRRVEILAAAILAILIIDFLLRITGLY